MDCKRAMIQKHNRIRRYSIVIGLLIAVGIGIKILFFPAAADPQYLTTKAAVADLEETVLASGTLEASKLVSVGAQVSGQIKSLKVALGENVKKGQLIAEIDSLPQQNALLNARASLENVRAQRRSKEATLKLAGEVFKRQQGMLALDAVSKESYQNAEATLETTRADIAALTAQITQAEIAVDTAKVNLAYTKIVAPIDGTVVATPIEEGQTVNSTQQAPTIVKLAQLGSMTIKAKISEADITRVTLGQTVYFTILGEPDHRYYATLRAIEPAPDSISTDTSSSSSLSTTSTSSTSSSSAIYFNGLFDVPNPEGKLRISMTAQVYIILNEAKGVLSIPRTALDEADAEGCCRVRVIDEAGRVVTRKVHIGINNNVSVQVIDGLQEGEQVVVGEAAAAGSESSQASRRPGPPPMGF
jgi:membrane fusion protein, macrolide-specific efflux system